MAEVQWTDLAVSELDQIIAYIDVFDPRAAKRMYERLTALADSLEDFPDRGRPGPADTRELVTIPPYILRYDVTANHVTILHVYHGARIID